MQLSKYDTKVDNIMNNNTRYFSSISLHFVNCIPLYRTLWHKFGSRLTEIKLIYVQLKTEELFEILQYIPKLKNLQLNANGTLFTTIDYSIDDFSKHKAFVILSQLQTLKMRIKMTNELFEHFFGATNQLKDFEYIENQFCYHNIEGSKLTSSDFGRFIAKNESTLENIRLQIKSCDNSFILGLLNLNNLKLKNFQIQNLDCDDKLFDNFCAKQNGIEVFETTKLQAGHLTSIVRYLKNLREFVIDKSPDVGDELKKIKQLTKLQRLSLSMTEPINDSIMFEIFNEKRDNLIFLKFESNITSEVLTRITELCPNLTELYLNFNNISPIRGIQMIFKNLIKLEVLSIEQNEMVR